MNSWHPENTLFLGQMCSDEGRVLGARLSSNTFMDPKRTLKRRTGVVVGVGGSWRGLKEPSFGPEKWITHFYLHRKVISA
jgi:hypothetical protein